jgi:hypothetical protein
MKMILIENVEVTGITRAVYSARNAMNSWDKSDSNFETDTLGINDYELAKRLCKAGTDHRKFMRMINVTMDITAPLYWISELDVYKVGTVRNSCSFMHKGVSKPFEITDFSIHDDRCYEVFEPLKRKKYELIYPYETDEYKTYTTHNGRKYKIYRNGRVVSCPFICDDTMGRHREFKEKECKPSMTPDSYYELNIGGRNGERWMLHRLVASVWLDNPNNCETVNHIDGDKGNNSVENLEWCDLSENIRKGFETGLYDNVKSIQSTYTKWKNSHTNIEPNVKANIICDYKYRNMVRKEIAEKYSLTIQQVDNILYQKRTENQELFYLCYIWEKIIKTLNELREEYLESKDESIFQQIRCLLPSGYNQKFTLQLNYEVLTNIYHSRQNHKLDEWRDFCIWIETLPYSELITGGNV